MKDFIVVVRDRVTLPKRTKPDEFQRELKVRAKSARGARAAVVAAGFPPSRVIRVEQA